MDTRETFVCYTHEARLLRHLSNVGFRPDVIFDIGSSHAGWSLNVSQIFPEAEFHLFEPLVDYKPFYRSQCEQILPSRPNFHLHKIGLGELNETRKIVSDKEGYGSSILLAGVFEGYNEVIPIQVWRLDDFSRTHHLPPPDFLKLDVQGAEMLIFSGASSALEKAKLIQVEVWFTRAYGPQAPLFHEIIDYLNSRGFRLFELGEMWYPSSRELFSCDAFFVEQDLLVSWEGKLPLRPLTLEP
jgi:FkbM family methyltransferase